MHGRPYGVNAVDVADSVIITLLKKNITLIHIADIFWPNFICPNFVWPNDFFVVIYFGLNKNFGEIRGDVILSNNYGESLIEKGPLKAVTKGADSRSS